MINPEIVKFLERWDREWAAAADLTSVQDRRKHFEVVAKNMRLPTPEDVETGQEYWVDAEPSNVRVRVFRHKESGSQPALIYFHGGAWMQGSPETHWDITARLASWCKQTVISVDYALSPEQPFPAAVYQGMAVVRWAFDRSEDLGIDANRIAVGGDSAGGNISAAIALHFRDSLQSLCAQLLIYPAVSFDTDLPSFKENASGPMIRTADMPRVNKMYCSKVEDQENPLAAPLKASSHDKLPPTFIAVAEYDPLRDSGLAYYNTLKEAGVEVSLDSGKGLIHGYLRGMEYCADSKQKLHDMADWLTSIFVTSENLE
ncbi:alpha/beta hydrolase [Saccharospirillum sp.]|uniref:alpha/beta hydrolase n=1 Tax=Saccharospirillum sp. TaxID=2033801 RepID=UPI0034A09B9B